MAKFNTEIIAVIKSFLKSEFNVIIDINPNNIVHSNSLCKSENLSQSINLQQFVKTEIRAYEQESKMHKNHFVKNWKNTRYLPSGVNIIAKFITCPIPSYFLSQKKIICVLTLSFSVPTV